jgi:predicted dehydrogenase
MEDKVQIGLLGCGLISQFAHLFALQKADGVRLAVVCDVAQDLAETVARQHGVERYSCDPTELLEDESLDAIVVATADQHHVAHAIECLRHGKHVLVEKPLGLTSAECLDLREAVRTSGRKLQVGNMKRYDPGVQFAHQFIEEKMGQRLSVAGWYCDSTARPGVQRTLRLPPVRSAAQVSFDPVFKSDKRAYKLVTHGVHLIDTLRFLGGEIIALQSRLAEKFGNLSWHGLLEFADGAVGHFELTTAIQMDWLEGFSVHGEGGSVELRSFLPFFYRPSEVRVFDATTGEYRSPIMPDSDPYERQVEAFAQAILRDTDVTPDVYDGIADLAVIEAVRESVETERRIELVRLPAMVETTES